MGRVKREIQGSMSSQATDIMCKGILGTTWIEANLEDKGTSEDDSMPIFFI